MNRLVIRCKAPDNPIKDTYTALSVNGVVASWADVYIAIRGCDGTETILDNVQSVWFESRAGSEPARAILTFIGVDIDSEIEISTEVSDEILFANERARSVHP